MAPMRQRRVRRFTQVSMLLIRLFSDGGSQPFFWFLRLEKRGWRYLVCLLLRLLRTIRRSSRFSLMSWPRWVSSAANTTCPVASLTNASPVVLLPGSILILRGVVTGSSTSCLRSWVDRRRGINCLLLFLRPPTELTVQLSL